MTDDEIEDNVEDFLEHQERREIEMLELPLACALCQNRVFHLWMDGTFSCTACGEVINEGIEN